MSELVSQLLNVNMNNSTKCCELT